jgi:hypothetical protein
MGACDPVDKTVAMSLGSLARPTNDSNQNDAPHDDDVDPCSRPNLDASSDRRLRRSVMSRLRNPVRHAVTAIL